MKNLCLCSAGTDWEQWLAILLLGAGVPRLVSSGLTFLSSGEMRQCSLSPGQGQCRGHSRQGWEVVVYLCPGSWQSPVPWPGFVYSQWRRKRVFLEVLCLSLRFSLEPPCFCEPHLADVSVRTLLRVTCQRCRHTLVIPKFFLFTFYLEKKKRASFTYLRKTQLSHELCLASIDRDSVWVAFWEWSQTVSALGGSDTQGWSGEAGRHFTVRWMSIWEPGRDSTAEKGRATVRLSNGVVCWRRPTVYRSRHRS